MTALTASRALVAATHAGTVQLVVIDTAGHRVTAAAAASIARMRAAGMPVVVVTSAYRTAAEQSAETARAAAGLTPSAAAIGTSWHEAGLAVDWPEPARSWIARYGAAHGWVRTLSSEPWHYVYDVSRDQHRATTSPAPVPVPVPEEDIMATLDDLRSVLREQTITLWRLAGTQAAWLDLGTARRWVTGAQAAGMSVRIVDLPATDPVWALPIVGPVGEVVRHAGRQAAWLVADGHRRWLDGDAYQAAGRPLITDLPPEHPVWSLPTVGMLPPEGA